MMASEAQRGCLVAGSAAELTTFDADVAHRQRCSQSRMAEFEIHNSLNSFQLPANPMIRGQPNVSPSCIRLSESLCGKQSSIESRSGGMPGESGEVAHILVVDDDAMVRQMITNFLKEQNVRAASVSSRQDLRRHLEKAHPSLILLDLRLGQEDGSRRFERRSPFCRSWSIRAWPKALAGQSAPA
jgi:Response regulator receiver domain